MIAINNDLHSRLSEIIDHARHDATVFAITTVILTPVFVALAVVVLLFALAFVDLPVVDHLGYTLSFVTGANLSLAFMVLSYFLRPKSSYRRDKRDWNWVAASLGFLCAVLGLSYATQLAKTHPLFFWMVYLLLALVMLGCIGHAYEPREHYYLSWTSGPFLFDDPFTVEDDIDRAHFSLGLAMALPHLIIESYAEIFGSAWLWYELEEWELSGAVELLQALAANDTQRVTACVRVLGETSAIGVVRTLAKVGMITIDEGRTKLCLKGQEFLDLRC